MLGKQTLFNICTSIWMAINSVAAKSILSVGNPRSGTTALELYFINRGDYEIYHEPVIRHLFSQAVPFVTSPYDKNFDSDQILRQVYEESKDRQVLVKELAWAIHESTFLNEYAANWDFVFLIRDPEQAVLSHAKLYEVNQELGKQHGVDLSFNPTNKTMNYDWIKGLFYRVQNVTNSTPILIDADQLTNDPRGVITELCTRLGIAFDEKHLKWARDQSTYWPYTKDNWQKDATESVEFTPLKNGHRLEDLPLEKRAELSRVIAHNKPIYEELRRHAIGNKCIA